MHTMLLWLKILVVLLCSSSVLLLYLCYIQSLSQSVFADVFD